MFDTARWLLSKDKKFVDSVQMALKLIAWAIPILVTGLKLRHLDVNTVLFYRALESTPVAVWVSGVALLFYYSSWILGAYFDLGMQKEVYKVPRERKLTWRDACTMLGVAIAFCALGFFLDRPVILYALLAILWVVNVFAWRYLVEHVVTEIASQSEQRYQTRNQYLKQAKLSAVRNYIGGSWQWWRFGAGGVLIAGLLGVSLFGARIPAPSGASQASTLLVVMSLFLLFVVIVEGWMWFKRLTTVVLLTELDRLGADYELTPRVKNASH